MKYYSFHPGPSFLPGWDFISITCRPTLSDKKENFEDLVHQFSFDDLLDEEDLPPPTFSEFGSSVLDFWMSVESALHQSESYVVFVVPLILKENT